MRNLLQLLLTLMVAGAMAWVVWQGYLVIAGKGAALEPVTQAVLSVAGVLVLVCTFILNNAVRANGKEQSRLPLLQRRSELYETFILLWQATLKEVKENGGTHLELQADELIGSLSLYAGSEVLAQFNELTRIAREEGIEQSQDAFEEMLFLMRADLGNSNLYPIRAELTKLFSSLPQNVAV